MRPKPPNSQGSNEDCILWQHVTQHVTPLVNRDTKVVEKSSENSRCVPIQVKNFSPKRGKALSGQSVRALTPIDLRKGEHAGLDGRSQRRLFRGNVPIDRRLDLHGYTAVRAETKLLTFLKDAMDSNCRCVLVITGKGAGVLSGHLPDWLKREPLSKLVLALAEARPTDGGSGAFYVLLRRRRK